VAERRLAAILFTDIVGAAEGFRSGLSECA
jgi:hypothetical protein